MYYYLSFEIIPSTDKPRTTIDSRTPTFGTNAGVFAKHVYIIRYQDIL